MKITPDGGAKLLCHTQQATLFSEGLAFDRASNLFVIAIDSNRPKWRLNNLQNYSRRDAEPVRHPPVPEFRPRL